MKKFFKSFTLFEIILFFASFAAIIISFFAFGNTEYFYLATSLIGLFSLTLIAKGRFIGQILTVLFGMLYATVSYFYRYYGEMATYLGMTAPIAIAAVVSWIRNPASADNRGEVKVNKISLKEYICMVALAACVTAVFYFILKYFNTNNLILSTVSVCSSFVASYLTLRRSRFYAFAYAANDLVLIALWVLASMESFNYLAMVMCFVVFLANDVYGFINWSRMQKRQNV